MGAQVLDKIALRHGFETQSHNRCMTSSTPASLRICAVVVTYNPHPLFMENIAAVGAQVDEVVIVDNGSSSETEAYLKELESRPGCRVLRNPRNLGIAAALNRGVRFAESLGSDWIATFDQDSRVSDGYVAEMLETYRNSPQADRVAIVTPTYIDRASGVRGSLLRSRSGELLTTITSGSLMPASVLTELGDFDESLYMDYVDIDYCLRARRQGMRILESPATLYHSLGRTTYHRILGISFGATNHSAKRRYYITRNRLRVLWRYGADWPWAWREVKAVLADAVKIVLVEDNKWKKFQAMLAGSIDALAGKMGKQVDL